MPSPFPGMDPYLEGDLWTTVHSQFAVEIARQLVPKIRPRYLAFHSEFFVQEMPEDLEASTHFSPRLHSRVPHVNVEIRNTKTRELVTVIEILSPSIKRKTGCKKYLSRRRRLLLSTAHLMEIDLLRQGKRLPFSELLPPAPYYILLSRFEKRPNVHVWPIRLDQSLPTVPVPLREDDPDVPLDLQLALTAIYDAIGYDLVVDYTQPPDVPLPSDLATWADDRLRASGNRP